MQAEAIRTETADGVGIEAVPLTPFLGAEITGLDLSRDVTPEQAARVRELFFRHQVIAVRGQDIAPEGFIRFAEIFGPIEPFFISSYNHPEHPQIYVLSNVRKDGKPIGRDGAGTHWHSDSTFVEKPSSVTLLHGVEVPARGGDTLFANMYDAYDRLDAETKALIDGRRAIHRYQRKEFVFSGDRELTAEEKAEIEELKRKRLAEEAAAGPSPTAEKSNKVPEQRHPVARTHPVTGRKALYLNDEMMVGIEGLDDSVAVPLLRRLCEEATTPDRVLRFKWRKGDLVAWDNASIIHSATFTPPDQARIMHRLTVEGGVPV
ncbi:MULTISPECIES: TauD/TfdA dioxygenase family protein [Thalassobaculum]|uniref:Taurine dioxygenase n=1 Tax=Thalassobaculum litoreum DSM 18839 TaxID=1123362 RepID=A0A8G2BGQ4_9PROT|nr:MULTISPECIES: TauD/TfdA family dioxygenase [Thalassobaculum]SDF44966.1 taurine dioxygenase [Thalassobaculum litoreum DSM 18839]